MTIGSVHSSTPDVAWEGTVMADLDALKGQTVDGVTLTKVAHTDGLWGDAAQAAMRVYAKKYDIVWAHSSYSDQVKKIYKKFPDTMFVLIGSGNEYLGDNVYVTYGRINEPNYVLGIIAGTDTKTNVIGVVAGFAADDVNDTVNAYFAGARSVNPNVKRKVTFIESWWDPPLAYEAASAQVAAGADHINMMAESYEACKEHKIVCYGSYRDWSEFAPEVVGGSAVISWQPHIKWAIKEWKKAKETGQWNGNKEEVNFLMKDGAQEMVLGKVSHSPEALARAEEAVAKLKSGELALKIDVSIPKSD